MTLQVLSKDEKRFPPQCHRHHHGCDGNGVKQHESLEQEHEGQDQH